MKRTNTMAGMIACFIAASGLVMQADAQSWSLNGNAGTTTTNYLGTSDSKPLTIKTAGAKRITITSGGKVGIGTATPAYRCDIFGGTGGADTVAVLRALVKKTGNFDIPALYGNSQPAAGYGIGILGEGNYIGSYGNGGSIGCVGVSGNVGVDGEASEVGNVNPLTGVQGLCSGGTTSVGIYGSCTGATNNYGVYGDQQDTLNSPDYALVGVGDVYGWRYYQASDRKLKKDIVKYEGALDQVTKLVASTYTFDHAKYPGMALPGGKQIGFMADNVQEIFPGLIKTAPLPAGATRDARGKVTYHSIPDVKTVNYMGLIPVLAEAIKEQKQIVDQKDAVIAAQNDKIAQLESKFNQLASFLQQNGKITPEQLKAVQISTEKASLGQNVPNPSNGISNISFYLPAAVQSANLQVVNALGVVVKTIPVSQRGNGQVALDATEFAAGQYSYSLIVDGKVVDTKNMMMTK